MASEGTAYKYTIPLDNTGGTASPEYDVSGSGETLSVIVGSTNVELVCTGACPHFHKDSINVDVEEVDKEEYT